MPRDRREARFAVGKRESPRSTIWKAWAQGDEAYILCRATASEAKVSIHSSGICQWSRTDAWVVRTNASRNADRHIVRWQVKPPSGNEAVMVFRVEIPVSEIRPAEPLGDRKKVFWISGAASTGTVRVVFYLTRAAELDPAHERDLPHQHLFSLRLRNGRWLIALMDQIALSQSALRAARQAVREQVSTAGISLSADHVVHLFLKPEEGAPAGLLELRGDELNPDG